MLRAYKKGKGALEGSILLWAVVLGVYLVAMVRRLATPDFDARSGWATLVGLAVARRQAEATP